MDKDKLADALFNHYIKPQANNKTAQKMRMIMYHYMTTHDPSYDIVRIKWEAPNGKRVK